MADNVFINGRAAIHKGSAGKSVAFPDVCLCPPAPPSGPIPTPLPNTAQAIDLAGGAATVTIEGNPIAHAKSYIAKSTGNEVARSTGGGVITHQVQGAAYFQTFSMNVFIESQPAVRHLDLLTHNHLARMPGNTPPAPWMATMDGGAGPAPGEVEKRVGRKKDWIKLRAIDQEDYPVSGVSYRVTTPDGSVVAGRFLRGGVVTLRGIEKGNCGVDFETAPAVPAQATGKNKDAQPYKDRPLKLATGKEHLIQITVPRVLCVTLPIDPTDQRYAKHRFILRNKDGSYEATRTVTDDAFAGDGRLLFEFPNLLPDKLYTLFHHDEAGSVGTIFADKGYKDLFAIPSHRQLLHRKESLVRAPAALVSDATNLKVFCESDEWLGVDPADPGDDAAAGDTPAAPLGLPRETR